MKHKELKESGALDRVDDNDDANKKAGAKKVIKSNPVTERFYKRRRRASGEDKDGSDDADEAGEQPRPRDGARENRLIGKRMLGEMVLVDDYMKTSSTTATASAPGQGVTVVAAAGSPNKNLILANEEIKEEEEKHEDEPSASD